MPRIYTSDPLHDRFWTFVVKGKTDDDCWQWTGATHDFGYGLINSGIRNKNGNYPVVRAHRLSWEIHHEAIPRGGCVLHRCDNPPCCNPKHLWVGTKRDNAQDASRKGRATGGQPPGAQHSQAKLSDADILLIRATYQKGGKTLKQVAEPYGISYMTVWRIARGLHRV